MKRLIIIGGGASGFFLAANIKSKNWEVLILEQAKQPLQKVKISGGGRCNITHACFTPRELVKFYPRGAKELLSVFSEFQPADTFEWFEKRKVNLKTEEDLRVFPDSNSSQTIVDLLTSEAEKNQVKIHYETTVTGIEKEYKIFSIQTNHHTYPADAVVIASGNSPKMWRMLENLGHSVISPVPSLFTFNCKHTFIENLPGTSFAEAEISIPQLKLKEFGPVLVTHWGLSGPAILRLSAWGARELAEINYNFSLRINWISEKFDSIKDCLSEQKQTHPKKSIYSLKIYNLTQRFWQNLLYSLEIKNKIMADVGKTDLNKIADALSNTVIKVNGKSTFKEEFVTAGGVDLKEVNFKNMQSKLIPDLYFSGEILNIDAITGGFNFQACWSEAYIISKQFE